MPFWKRKRSEIKETPPEEKVILGRVAYSPPPALPTLPVDAGEILGDSPQGILLDPAPRNLRRSFFEQVAQQPGNPTLWVLLGWSSKDARTAANYFRLALQVEPENPVARDGLEWALAELGPGFQVPPAAPLTAASAGPLAGVIEPGPAALAGPAAPLEISAQLTPAFASYPLTRPLEAGLAGMPRPRVRDFRWHTLTRFYQIPFFRNLAIAVLYLLLISAAEFVTVLVNATVGIIFHATIMIGLLVHGSVIQQGPFRRFLIILSLAPLIRLLSMSLPMAAFPFPVMYRYMIVGVPIFLAAYFAARSVGLAPNRLYFTWKGWPFQLLFSLTGFLLGYAEYRILRPASLVPDGGLFDISMAVFILFVFTGFLEEFVFRSLLQVTGIQLFGGVAIWIISILFGVLHIGYYSVVDVVFAATVGLAFGYFAFKTRSILGTSLAHGITNITLYVILPFLLH